MTGAPGLSWRRANLSDPSLAGYDGDYLVGDVVPYDVPPGWAGFISGNRVEGGPWPTVEEACAAVDAAWRAQPPRQRR